MFNYLITNRTMKKLLLLSVAAAVSLSAAAINPELLVKPENNVKLAREFRNNVKKVDTKVKKAVASQTAVAPNKMKLSAKGSSAVAPRAEVMAGYYPPSMYNWGYSEDFYGYSSTIFLGSAYVDQTWMNASTGATQYTWTYMDPEATSETEEADLFLTSTDEDLTVYYGLGQFDVPILTASDGTNTDEYSYGSFMQLGANSYIFDILAGYPESEAKNFGAAMFDYGSSYYDYNADETMFDESKQLNTNVVSQLEALGYKNPGLDSYGVIFSAPETTYSMSKMWMRTFSPNLPAGTQITANIYSLPIEGGYYDFDNMELIANAVFEATEDMSSSENFVMAVFNVMVKDPVTGLYMQGSLNVNTAIFISIPSKQEGYEMYPVFSLLPYELSDYVQGYGIWCYSYDGTSGREVAQMSYPWIFSTQDGSQYVLETFEMMTDATFGWFIPESDRITDVQGYNVLTAATAGETVTIPVNSLYLAEQTTSISVWSEDGDTDWVSCTITDEADGTGSNINLTVEALPSGVTGRKCTITFTPEAADPYKLTIGQGTVGVESAVVTSAAQVSVVGGNFVVSAPESINAVTVYNVAGQAVATSEIAGNTTVDASSLAKGVYVLRFNDGSTVKVIK